MSKKIKHIICPNVHCGYQGPARRVHQGSALVCFFLLLFAILPGIIYAVATDYYRIYCPKCGLQLGKSK